MIICGHALIGKSTLAQKEPVCIDLESSVFCQGNFDRYAQMILTLHQQGKVVLTSCHGALREILRLSRISYFLVLPHPKEKDRYYDLAKARQPHPLQPELVLSQWDNWQEHKKDENVYRLPIGKHLSEVFVVCGRGKYALDPCLALAAERGERV